MFRLKAWLMLMAAIALEILGLSLLEVFKDRPILSKLLLILLINLSYFLMSLTLRQIAVGVAYATWEIVGGIGVLLVSLIFFAPTLSTAQYLGIIIGFTGIVCIILGEDHSDHSQKQEESSLKDEDEKASLIKTSSKFDNKTKAHPHKEDLSPFKQNSEVLQSLAQSSNKDLAKQGTQHILNSKEADLNSSLNAKNPDLNSKETSTVNEPSSLSSKEAKLSQNITLNSKAEDESPLNSKEKELKAEEASKQKPLQTLKDNPLNSQLAKEEDVKNELKNSQEGTVKNSLKSKIKPSVNLNPQRRAQKNIQIWMKF
ncbi:DMT family transporter [Campylobacter troglodytis]|uniref:DMT family transporter n=1 Tax=Campylobacter troglodytis TaxID=654363 RepID=UPI00115888AD|nr:multidrug efflux SMR transporter [Campylobacter troglodytis]TQR57744.1 hypothetical protein DMC01_08330 [Campylobacter troglodytis]